MNSSCTIMEVKYNLIILYFFSQIITIKILRSLFIRYFTVTWMKGLKDITDGPRSYKETIDDYVRLTLKRVVPSDEGTYCILLKNRYGCDRSFFSIKVNFLIYISDIYTIKTYFH